ncbi:MAG: hypothetical protein ACREDJ_00590 [Methylocella sp.]
MGEAADFDIGKSILWNGGEKERRDSRNQSCRGKGIFLKKHLPANRDDDRINTNVVL